MRKLFLLLISLVLVAGCEKPVDQAEVAGQVAKTCYDYLLNGEYEAFVDCTWHEDSIRPFYRTQLVENMKMFMAQQQKEHQGIKGADVSEVQIDTANHVANVFMTLSFGDKTSERVLVPLVEHDGTWYLK